MNNNRITFIGSTSHKSARNNHNGECMRVVNLRRHDNSMISVGNHAIHCVLSDPSHILTYVHTCNGKQHLISQCNRTLYHEVDIDTDNTTTLIHRELLTLDNDLSSITSIGTTLVATTATSVHYILHKDDGYKILGSRPPMPTIRFHDKYIEREGMYVPSTALNGKMNNSATDNLNSFTDLVMGSYYKIRDSAYEKFRFIQPYMVRYALRLYDGSHILPSPPVLLGRAGYREYAINRIANLTYDSATDKTTIQSFPMFFELFGIEYTIDKCDISDWHDIVCGIDVFISKEITLTQDKCIDFGTFKTDTDKLSTYQYTLPLISSGSMEQLARDETLFYKLATIDIDSITEGVTTEITHEIRPDHIIYQQRLEVDTSGFERIGANKSYVYNGRLHLADLTRQYYEGYPLALFAHTYNSDGNTATAYIRTHISHPNGYRKEVLSYATIPCFDYKLSPLLSFPDANATAMEIGIRHDGYEYSKRFELDSISLENRAVYAHPLLEDIDVSTWDKIEVTTDNLNDFPTESSSFYIQSHNEMIVSELNNPFYFPTELSFNISNGTIVGIATTTVALSQGQYGEFPLYIFTDEGIWSMQQGDGEVCYARCTLINNASVDKNTPLITTENNIIYRSGNNLLCLNGTESSLLLPLDELKQSRFEASIPTLLATSDASCTDNTSLHDYIGNDISIGYLPQFNELIFCNPSYNYMQVLHLPSGHIYRLSNRVRRIVNSNNRLLAQSHNNAIYDLNRTMESTSEISLISHPIQLIPDTYTRLRQVVLRMSCSNASITVSVLASHEPDGTYGNIFTATYDGELVGHLPIKLHAPAYKYYRMVIRGRVAHDFTLDCADFSFEATKSNKLR